MKNNFEVAKILNELLAQIIDCTLQAKHCHWNVRGQHFIAYHKLFDEIHKNLNEQMDIVAERISVLDQHVYATLQEVFNRTTLTELPKNIAGDLEYIEKLQKSLEYLSENLKNGTEKISKLEDKVTSDMLSMVILTMDKYSWFLRAHIEKPI
jgi:starvation-inducible DNA-binding protein